jgi:hypothetical protein
MQQGSGRCIVQVNDAPLRQRATGFGGAFFYVRRFAAA